MYNKTPPTDELTKDAARVAPRPQTIEATGLTSAFLGDLVEKHLFEGGVLSMRDLVSRTALSGRLLEELLSFLRQEGRIEVRAQHGENQGLGYALTERGRGSAMASLMASGYIGPTPVPLDYYNQVVLAQSVRGRNVTRERMIAAFEDTVLDPALLDRLGPAMNSGKAIFVYGAPGTGKTFITQRLARLFDDTCLIPHAISIGDTVVRVFDPSVHRQSQDNSPVVMLTRGHDPRYVLCQRPLVITGGELTADMLEVQFDPATRQYRAPLQVKANGGMLILDDLGRQRIAPTTVLNRWILPMEEGVDYLSMNTGQHFRTPFDVILVFSTNLQPRDLVDDAFLRRIGYKIGFHALNPRQYHMIWQRACEARSVRYDALLCQFVIDALYKPTATPLLPCHPRDLIGMALDRAIYLDDWVGLTAEALQWAWDNYFVTTPGSNGDTEAELRRS
ncbi:AAA family ATPase [Steroidobacter flavus]|uniref:AAA family ATPase n=1 Tax=Steroidobacter flavus TaxID=1842136 RepID=A0ABV8T3K1_9GAMM